MLHEPSVDPAIQRFAARAGAGTALRRFSSAGEVTPDAPDTPIAFALPPELEAHGPPEATGGRRDAVKLLVLNRRTGAVLHTRFDRIVDHLHAGDLLVFNDSRTIPALLPATIDGAQTAVEARLARRVDAGAWEALLLPHGGDYLDRRLLFRDGLSATVTGNRDDAPWLWRLRFDRSGDALIDAIYRAGEPVRYTYVPGALPLDLYQTVYAREPGSVEMPSAGRPFSWEVLLALRRKGVGTAFITLHTGLSSTRNDEFDALRRGHEEWYRVSPEAAAAINAARARGGRVIAVGTTVVRTLETLADGHGVVHAGKGWTSLYISAAHRLRAVDGLLTGLHEPRASHLDLLTAFVPPALLAPAYRAALAEGYLWHEFGDVNLIA
jgi:S-adenosylmethionine:tRNA ribosyltransferase-isomerase